MNKQLIDAARTAVDALDDAAQLAFLARSCEFHVDASKYSECSELLRAALEAAQREQVSVACRPLTDVEALRMALDALSCTGDPDDPGHRCGHCDEYVDRNSVVRKLIRAVLAAQGGADA